MGTMHTDFCSMVNVQNAIRNYINQIMGLLFYRVELQCLHCRFEFTVLRSNKDYLYAGPVNNNHRSDFKPAISVNDSRAAYEHNAHCPLFFVEFVVRSHRIAIHWEPVYIIATSRVSQVTGCSCRIS